MTILDAAARPRKKVIGRTCKDFCRAEKKQMEEDSNEPSEIEQPKKIEISNLDAIPARCTLNNAHFARTVMPCCYFAAAACGG